MHYEKNVLVEDKIYAYLIACKKNLEILDGNQLTEQWFAAEQIYPKLTELFVDSAVLEEALGQVSFAASVSLQNVALKTASGVELSCDVEICLTDVTRETLFLIIKGKMMESGMMLKDLVELDENPVIVMDEAFIIHHANQQFFRCICMDFPEFKEKAGGSLLNMLEVDKVASFEKAVINQMNLGNEIDLDIEITIDGQYYHLFRLNAHKSAVDGRLYGVLVSIKRQSELMKKIEYDQQYFDIMQRFSKDLLFRIDIKKRTLVHRGDISKFDDLLPEVFDFPESIRDTRWVHPEDLEGYIAFAYRLIHGMDSMFEPRFQFQNGKYERYRLQGSVLFDENGNPVQVVGKAENIQKYVDIEAKANYDSLTTALNKGSFTELVSNMLERAVDSDRFALLFMDFDNFKQVNDTMGHAFGDFLLEATTKRILHCVRNHDKVGRVGGDEFVIFFQHAPNEESVLERAEAILNSLRREFNNGDLRYKIRASIGISLYPSHGKTYESLYHKADLALYQSKERGKDVATIYSED